MRNIFGWIGRNAAMPLKGFVGAYLAKCFGIFIGSAAKAMGPNFIAEVLVALNSKTGEIAMPNSDLQSGTDAIDDPAGLFRAAENDIRPAGNSVQDRQGN